MSDEQLRRLERQWRDSGTIEDGYRWAQELHRAGGTSETDTLRNQIHCLIKYGATHPDDLDAHHTLDMVVAEADPFVYAGRDGLFITKELRFQGQFGVYTRNGDALFIGPDNLDQLPAEYVWIQDCSFTENSLVPDNFLKNAKNVICADTTFGKNINLFHNAGSQGHFYAHNIHLGQTRGGLSQLCSKEGYG